MVNKERNFKRGLLKLLLWLYNLKHYLLYQKGTQQINIYKTLYNFYRIVLVLFKIEMAKNINNNVVSWLHIIYL